MLNSVVLNVVIDLVFIYLLYSLLITTIQEIIATRFGFRAKILQRAVFRMLEDEEKFASRFKSVYYLFKKTGNGGDLKTVSHEFYTHPLILFLGEGKSDAKPAYINKETFSKVLVDMLRGKDVKPGDDAKPLIQKALDNKSTTWGNSGINDQTLSYLRSIWADADGDTAEFKKHIENWFDETMDRASGWYKKYTQVILFFVGLSVSIVFNVDTIKIVDKLEKDPNLREQLVQQADAFERANPELVKNIQIQKAAIQSLNNQLKSNNASGTDTVSLVNAITDEAHNLKNSEMLKVKADSMITYASSLVKSDLNNIHHSLGLEWESYECQSSLFLCILKSMMGWIITALALSLGAPFWFDLLNRLMKLRGSVATPTSDDREKKQG